MKLLKKLKKKNGLVIETAVLFMVAIFSFCFLLSTLTLIGHNRAKVENIKMDQDVTIDRILDEYLLFLSSVPVPEITTAAPETTKAPETTAAPKTEDQNSNQSDVVNALEVEPIDISYEYPLLSPIDNASDEGSEVTESSETTAAPETTKETFPTFWDYVNREENKERFELILAAGYSFTEQVHRENSNTVEFTLLITRNGNPVMSYIIKKMSDGYTLVFNNVIVN